MRTGTTNRERNARATTDSQDSGRRRGLPEAHGEDIVAIGRYFLDPHTNRAEVAFTVRDDWQNRGIGTFLVKYLVTVARRNGIAGFTAEVLADNKRMQAVFNKSGTKISSHLSGNVYSYQMEFE